MNSPNRERSSIVLQYNLYTLCFGHTDRGASDPQDEKTSRNKDPVEDQYMSESSTTRFLSGNEDFIIRWI
jgi:hypothetical protein